MPKVTQDILKRLLHYSVISGKFYWKEGRTGTARKNSVAGCRRPDGYITIGINGKPYLAHRLAFLYVVGKMPVQGDHQNHIQKDNSWINLAPADHSINGKNMLLKKNNSSGICGVNRSARGWQASIKINYKRYYLYFGNDFFEACCYRKAAELKNNFHANHGLNKKVSA